MIRKKAAALHDRKNATANKTNEYYFDFIPVARRENIRRRMDCEMSGA